MSTKLGLVDMTITECRVFHACMLHALLKSHASAHALLGLISTIQFVRPHTCLCFGGIRESALVAHLFVFYVP